MRKQAMTDLFTNCLLMGTSTLYYWEQMALQGFDI